MQGAPSYEIVGLAIFAFLSLLPLFLANLYILPRIRSRERFQQNWKRILAMASVTILVYLGVVIDAFWVEPNSAVVTTIALDGPFEKPLRLLHLSDLHLEKQMSPRDSWLINCVKELKPDLILITGDTHQIGNPDTESLRKVLCHINAPLGVYHCTGYDNVSILTQAAPHIEFLENRSVVLPYAGKRIGLAGLLRGGNRNPCYEAIAGCDYRIMLNHTPELANEAIREGMDLYLCGHTHGGQVRIPFWGAIITNNAIGKRFEAGHYMVGKTSIYTSRGLGLEPRPAPQVRFFCKPEITLFLLGRDH